MRMIRFAPLLASALGAASPALAQPRPDVVDFALDWARGGYASPVICRFGEEVHRGLRRVVVSPGPRTSAQRVLRLQIRDLEAEGADRCHDELGGEEQNAIGTLHVTYVSKRPRSDTPERDFKQELESGSISYEIVAGLLRVGPASAPTESLRAVDFAGGTAALHAIEPGSDEARRLEDLRGGRRLRLELEAPDATRLAFPLVEVERR